jgi:hypothetical protein
MKFFSILTVVFFSFLLLSCEHYDNTIAVSENSEISNLLFNSPQVFVTDSSLTITQTIEGNRGGSIVYDSSFVDGEGDTIQIHVKLTFLPNSFIGTQEISLIPNFESGSIQFFPEMVFNKKLLLDLSYANVDLANLGFTQNSQIDFVYLADNGNVEFLSHNGCKINWNKSELFVQNALLQHFSRYAFVRKSSNQ